MKNLTLLEPASRTCKKCGSTIFYERFKRFPEMGPTLCDSCGREYDKLKRKEALEEIFESLLSKSELPLEYMTWDNDAALAYGSDIVLSFMRKNVRNSVYVYGNHGKGKTHTVAYCAFMLLKNNRRPVHYLNLGKWLSKMMTYKIAHVNVEPYLHRLYSVDLVVIDDLGKEKLSESKLEIIYNVIDMRERQRKQTWFTSNMSIDNLSSRLDENFGPAIVERVRRMVADNIFFVSGEDRRKDGK